VAALLQRGQAALAEYDFAAAEEHLRAALLRSRGDAGPAAALLELLVEHLAQDQEAVALLPHLSPEALAHPPVRLLLGLAAARAGDGALARQLAPPLPHPRAAEIFVALARHAVAQAAPQAAAELLEEAREHDPAHPEIPALRDEIVRLRAAERAGDEEQLRQLVAAGDLAGAEARARAIVARWPDSEPARRTLRELQERRRTEAAAELLRQAQTCAGPDRAQRAHALLGQALELLPPGPQRDDVVQRLRALEVEAQAREEQARVADTAHRLSDPAGVPEGLRRYVELPARLRDRVREQIALPHLAWLDQVAAGRTGKAAAEACEAVLALAEARDVLAADPQRALALLAPHERLLSALPEARTLQREARQRSDEDLRQAARRAIAGARTALQAGDPAQVEALLGAIEARVLPATEQDEVRGLRQQAQTLRDEAIQVAAYEHELAKGDRADYFLARKIASRMLSGERSRSSPDWKERVDAVQRLIHAAFRSRVRHEPEPVRDPPDLPLRSGDACLLPGGEGIAVHAVLGRWIFLRLLDLDGCVRTRVVLRTPEPLGDPAITAEESALHWAGGGGILSWCLPQKSIGSWLPCVPPLDHLVQNNVALAPGGRYVWTCDLRRSIGSLMIFDVERTQTRSKVAFFRRMVPLPLQTGPCMVAFHAQDGGLSVFTPRGDLLFQVRQPGELSATDVAVHPGTGELVVFTTPDVTTSPAPGHPDPGDLGHGVCGPDGQLRRAPHLLPHTPAAFSGGAATARAGGMVFLLERFNKPGSWGRPHCQIVALAPEPLFLKERGRFRAPPATELLADRTGQVVVALSITAEGFRAARLGTEPPGLPDHGPAWGPLDTPGRRPVLTCRHRMELQSRIAGEILKLNEGAQTPAEMTQRLSAQMAALADDPVRVVAYACVTALNSLTHGLQKEACKLLDRHLDHPSVRLFHAEGEAAAGNWDRVIQLIGQLDVTPLDAQHRGHRCHLLAQALVATGRIDEAEPFIEWARRYASDSCRVDGLAALVRALRESPADGEAEHPMSELVNALRAADACLQAGDPAGARRASDRPVVWQAAEVQSLARLAAAYLADPGADHAGGFRRAMALAAFLAAYEKEEEMLLPGLAWDAERLAALAEQVRAWLEAAAWPE
jgi:hypothetical protein